MQIFRICVTFTFFYSLIFLGIRYNYGKEGKKVDWTPYNCMKIINDSPSPGEQHGCPYRHQVE